MSTTATLPVPHLPAAPLKRFTVLGDEVEILVSTEQSNGTCTVISQTSLPGGGPPPHVHQHEDEVFHILEGEFHFLTGATWRTLKAGDTAFAPRGLPHTFNNRSTAPARILCTAFPGNFQHYLEQLSHLSAPQDMPEILALSARFGITFL